MESNDPKKSFELIPSETDPETGKITYDVKYSADFPSLYRAFSNLKKEYEKFLSYDEIKKDSKFEEIYNGFNYLFNQYKSHMRKNYPKQYSLLKEINDNLLRELVQKHLKEMSATGAGISAATYTPGESENTAPKYAFNPNKKAKGTQNTYYYKLTSGYKPVDAEKLHKQAKGLEHKELWTKKLEENESTDSYVNSLNIQDPSLKQFIDTRMTDFDKIEDKLNILFPLLKSAKTDTMEYYKTNPDFKIKYSTDLAVDYLDDLITLFKEKK
jgi:hypothetical protein